MKTYFLLLSLMFIFLQCKKKEACAMNFAAISGSYKLSSVKYTPDANTAEQDVTSSLPACYRDNNFIFNADGSFFHEDAGSLCSPAKDAYTTWSLSGSNILFGNTPAAIESFTCNTLTYYYPDYQVTGDRFILILVKQ